MALGIRKATTALASGDRRWAGLPFTAPTGEGQFGCGVKGRIRHRDDKRISSRSRDLTTAQKPAKHDAHAQ